MAMKSLVCENLTQAYNADNWEYTNWDSAYAGYAGSTVYGVTVLRFDVPKFSGISKTLDVDLISYTGLGADVTLRWALCTSDANKELYTKTAEAVEDSNQIGSGTITIPNVTETTTARAFQIPTTKLKGGNTYYLFLWAYDGTGISIRAASSGWGNHSVFVGYYPGIVRVKTNGQAKPYMVFAKYGNEVKQMIPYVKTQYGIRPGG